MVSASVPQLHVSHTELQVSYECSKLSGITPKMIIEKGRKKAQLNKIKGMP